MHPSIRTMVVALFLTGPLLAAPSASAGTLKLAGTGGAMPMAEHEDVGFTVATGIKIEVIPGLGSRGAIRAVADGAIDIAISARQLTPEELPLGLTVVPIARTALVFVTSHPKPNSLKSKDLAAIISAPNPTWADGSPLHLILRPKFDADTILIGQFFPGVDVAIKTAQLRPEVPVALARRPSDRSLTCAPRAGGEKSLSKDRRNCIRETVAISE